MLAALLIAFLAAAPFVALACGAWVHAIGHRVQAAQQSSWHQVPAVVLQAPRGPQAVSGYAALEPQSQVRWTAPDGKAATGEVPVLAGTAVGTVVQVWTTRDGQLTDPPLLDTQVSGQAQLAATFGVIGLAGALTITGLLARRALDRRRMAAWDADWRAIGQQRWTPGVGSE